MNFNLDWDEPDIWSTEPSSSIQINTSRTEIQNQPSSPTNQSDSSDTTTIHHHQINLSTPNPTLTNSNSNSNSNSNHSQQPNLSISTDSIPKPFINLDSDHQSSPNSPSILFSSPSDASSTQSMFSATADQAQSQSQSNNLNNSTIDDDDFGDFDDGDELGQGLGTDEFGDFDTFPSLSPIPTFQTKPNIIPFKLPKLMNFETLKESLTPAIDSLFTQIDSSVWLTDDVIKNSDHPPIEKNLSIPLVLKSSDQLRSAWNELIENQNRLGIPIDWKRSQIRRHFLVTLGIPVDLNDFLTPADLPQQKLSVHTDSVSSSLLHPYNSTFIKPSIKSPTPTILIDRKRCDELLSLKNEDLQTQSDEDLIKIRDELKNMNTTISDLLSQTLTKRDKLNQDSDSYNKMISDLITAAQRIKMGSPNVNKRSSSIQLGSSSITSAAQISSTHPAGSSRWFGTTTRSVTPTNHHQNVTSKSVEINSKRSSVL